ncbi:cupin domain-containing protein [Nocardioides caricicola]|uniref:Cupin domain-containing protein n=1 Tax=Nocardioides caricicola TaxID=634770 RepID=A0ABW0N1B6_9ACTN
MSYPPPTYHADGGEPTAWLRRSDHPAELDLRHGGAAHFLATGASTSGRFGLYRWDMGPRAGGPDPHFHRTMSESFFILSGTVMLHDGTDWRATGAGDFAHVPEGGIHGFRNESDEPASMLILFAPGAPREAYFTGLVELGEGRWKPTEQELADFFVEHDNHFI